MTTGNGKAGFIERHVFCSKCDRLLAVRIPIEYLAQVSDNGLFNYVALHAHDHALVLSIDKDGNVRRTRAAAIDLLTNESDEIEAASPVTLANPPTQQACKTQSLNEAEQVVPQITKGSDNPLLCLGEFSVAKKTTSLSEAFSGWLEEK